MPTGPTHHRFFNHLGPDGRVESQDAVICRCTVGEDHLDENSSWGVEDVEEDSETRPFDGDEEIWDSSGHDDDYDFRP